MAEEVSKEAKAKEREVKGKEREVWAALRQVEDEAAALLGVISFLFFFLFLPFFLPLSDSSSFFFPYHFGFVQTDRAKPKG